MSADTKNDLQARTLQKVAEVVAEVLAVPRERVQPEARLLEDLGATSLDMATLFMLLEDELGMKLPDTDPRAVATIQDTVAFVLKHLPPGREGF